MNIRADINLIEQVSQTLKDWLGEDFDAETFWDSLDGETDIMDIAGRLIAERVEAQSHEQAAKDVMDKYAARKKRMQDKQKAISASLGVLLDAAGERKLAHPLATISRTKGRVSCKVFDEAAIPSQLTVTTVKPDTAAIKKQLEAGETVPGAELVTGADGVTVRIV